jgi:hypothetical protein
MDIPPPTTQGAKRRRARMIAWAFVAIMVGLGAGVAAAFPGGSLSRGEVEDGFTSRSAYDWTARRSEEAARRSTAKPVPARDTDLERADQLAEELSRRISEHEGLPQDSFFGALGLGRLAKDQRSNEAAMIEILNGLAEEIGATKAAGAIRALRENRERQVELEGVVKSGDPEKRSNAKEALQVIREENGMFEEFVRQSFVNEGVELSREQVRALCASPNAEDTASMISAFGALKAIAGKMEERLRWTPSQEQAQKYYGAHYAMLLALDKIQEEAMANIRDIYIPGTNLIAEDARKISDEAAELLGRGGFSPDESQALRWNIATCSSTVKKAELTKRKLEKNLGIIGRAREKLARSLATAKNCHATAMLQKQVLWLEGTALQEFARIEALTIPPLAAVNFADPETPEVSLATSPLM